MFEILRDQPVIALFLTLGFGYLIGRIRIAGITLGAMVGTLLVALLLGQYGLRIAPGAQAVGFAMFIFSVGFQAGPHFIQVLKAQGWRYLSLSLVVAAIGFATAYVAGRLLILPPGGMAGLLAGALTTTPMLAAAQESVRSGIAALPSGTSAEQVIATIGTNYAITYMAGMIGLIVIIKTLPRIMGIDLADAAARLEVDSGKATVNVQARGYRVVNPELCSLPVSELATRFWDGFAVVRVRRGDRWLTLQAHDRLAIGDEIHVYGDAALFRRGHGTIGEEIEVATELGDASKARRVVVTQPSALGRSMADLNLARATGVVVLEVRRDGHSLPLALDLQLRRGDVLSVFGPSTSVDALSALVGPVEADTVETDMTTFAFGIALGTAIGLLTINIAGVPVGLGAAGGLLAAGVAMGWLNSVRPTIGRFPEAARWILMEFGLLIFVCGVGLQSGSQVMATLREGGPLLIVAALVVVSLPVAGGYAFGRYVLRLDPVILLGALTGAMTSGPALNLLTAEARSTEPVLGYTGTYAFSCIIMALCGTLAVLI
ncbi:aspartate:alanine exchanger family transporter [Povalibacter sp.]|uniref:aspartate:alanine exchanger family transporter n=1 Tax=Povalibacter sp. TaxID=1962978 RepID=UPI002F42147B